MKEGNSLQLVVEKIGTIEIPVIVTLSTIEGSASGKLSIVFYKCGIDMKFNYSYGT